MIRVPDRGSRYVRRSSWSSDDNTRRVTVVSPRGRSKTRETVTVQDSSGKRLRRRSVTNVDDYIDDDHYSPPGRSLSLI